MDSCQRKTLNNGLQLLVIFSIVFGDKKEMEQGSD